MRHARTITAGFAALLATSLIALGGCAVTETSNIEQYQAEAESIATEIVAMVPPTTEVLEWDSAIATGGGNPDAEVWWQVAQAMNAAEGVDAGAQAAGEAITAGLEADGWDAKPLDRSDEKRAVLGFNRDDADGEGWYVEVRYRLGESARGLDFIVVSPTTPAP